MKKFAWLTMLAILLPVLLFGFIGCMKKPDHTPNYGPEVTWEDIQKAAINDMPPDPMQMKEGQYTSIDITQTIDVQMPMTLSQRLDRILKRTDTTTEANLEFEVKLNELDASGTWKQSIDYPKLSILKDSAQSTVQNVQAKSAKIGAMSLKALKATDQQTPVKVTYHNLEREDGFMPVPILVQNQPDCGGLKDCAKGLRYMRLSFDRVVWETDAKGTKTAYRITFSPDIPTYVADWNDPEGLAPSNQFQFCFQTWLEIQNGSQTQVVPVQQCADMRDFQHGT